MSTSTTITTPIRHLDDGDIPLRTMTNTNQHPGYRLDDLMTPDTSESPSPDRERIYAPAFKGAFIVALLSTSGFLSSMSTGLLTTSIPRMSVELSVRPQESYWPTSVYGLTSGACLLLAGAIADVVGSKRVFLAGSFLMAVFVLASGLANAGNQLVGFRALQGIANAMCLPTTVSLLTGSVPPGRRRNIGFGCAGLAQPLGFSVGLVMGGVFMETVGWRVGWYIVSGILFFLVPAGAYLLPSDDLTLAEPASWKALRTKIDWVGVGIACSCLATLALGLLQISASESSPGNPSVVAPLAISGALMPTFVYWMGYAQRRGWPVLIPNELWRQLPFTGICVIVLLSYAVLNTLELFTTLFFQNVQALDALQSSLRLLPSVIVGMICNICTGTFIHRIRPLYLVLGSSVLCAGAPLLMALIDPAWPYWYAAFPAQLLLPLSVDVLFCVGVLVTSEMFPENTQALAGAVFNTCSQMGSAIGLAVLGVIADRVTEGSHYEDKAGPEALGKGYSAGFWACFAFMVCTCVVAVASMRTLKKVGVKQD
ncbi:Major facilitator superfamily domain containing protein [Rhypophila decipiens]